MATMENSFSTDDRPGALDRREESKAGAFKKDFLASVVVFLVALPLCLGIANACGVQPAAGLITGVVGGLVVGALAGCPLQVSGPAAGLVVIVAEIVHDERLGVGRLGVVVLGAGLLQLLAGACRLGRWFRAVSPAVIEGMLAGIGVLIFASQFHVLVDDKPRGDGIANILSLPEAVVKGLTPSDDVTHDEAARIGLLTLAALVGWKLLAPKKARFLPAQLVAVVVGTAACAALRYPILRVSMPENIAAEVLWPSGQALSRAFEGPVLLAMVTVAFIASAETLLCATAVDQFQGGPRTRYDKELAAQGVGNLLCGLLGALPVTGVIVRSATNVEAGARTRLSAVLHGAWLLVTVLLLAGLLRQVPLASLAAVLVYTGYKLVDLKAVKGLWAWGWGEVAIYFCTLIAVVSTDLLKGVLLGVALSVVKLVVRFTRLSIQLETGVGEQRAVLRLGGAATFLRLPLLADALAKVPEAAELHVHFENLRYIDHACLELLTAWEKQHEAGGGSLVIDWDTLHARFHDGGRL
jgi:MFS superfamily sulfate permease-like transporter